jgi:hypothetical protein
MFLLALYHSTCRLTPGITRRPEPLREFNRQRVGGRVHAVVMPRRFHRQGVAVALPPLTPLTCQDEIQA